LLDKRVEDMDGYKDVADMVEKAIVPADVPSWLAEEFSTQVLEDLELELKIEGLFAKINMPENRNQFSIPAIIGDVQAYLIAPGDDAIESAISSAKVTFETKRIKTLVGVTDQADHESVVMMTDIVRARLVKSLAKASEDAIINGDTTIADNNDVRKAFDGLLKLAIDAGNVVDGGGTAPTAATIAATRQVLGVYGVNLADLVIIVNFSTAFKLLELDEVITVDKYGPAATIITGELGKIWGIPIVVSEYVRTDLDSTGQNPGTGTNTVLLMVNKGYFAVADRGNVTVEVERRAVSSTNLYVGFRDFDFKMLSAGFTPVSTLVNIV
jgi:HK97 family phage major capsid protein